jgi:hypothetical protein
MKRFLLGTPSYKIKDFDIELKKIDKYESVSFIHNNKKVVFTKEEIVDRLNREECPNCMKLKMRLKAMQILESHDEPDVQIIIKHWLKNKYVKTSKRIYPRRKLFEELNFHLGKYHIVMLDNKDKLWKYVIEILNDNSSQYRKFKLKRRGIPDAMLI